MKLLKKILLPINPEYYTKDSFEFAIKLARLYQSEIIPIHVISREAEFKTIKDIALNLAREHASKVHSRIIKEGITAADPAIEFGNHADRITITALKQQANVILFGIKKSANDGNSKLNLTIEKVIRHSEKPVWAIKEGGSRNIKKILCPVDFSVASRRAVLNAIHLSQKFTASLTLLNVFTPVNAHFTWLTGDYSKENENLYSANKAQFEEYLRTIGSSGMDLTTLTRTGEPDQEIVDECRSNKYDLLIMGTTGHSIIGRIRMGSITEKVIRQTPCSFIIARSEDLINLRLETKVNNIKNHYDIARQKQKMGLTDEAIGEYMVCLTYNDMHIPSLLGLSEAYGRKNDKEKENFYRNIAHNIVNELFKDHIKI